MKKLIGLDRRGFTLIEVIVVAAIIAILAGILVPMIFNQIDESKKAKALADCKSIQASIMTFQKDTGQWPTRDAANGCVVGVTLLGSSLANNPTTIATLPVNANGRGFLTANPQTFDQQLSANNGCYGTTWRGAYIPTVPEDPWGNAYIINASDLSTTNAVFILSGGSDGQVDTDITNPDTTVNTNDIGVRLK